MGTALLEVNHLKTKYCTKSHDGVYAVDDVSIELKEGQILGIAGESDCGKSALADSLMGYFFQPLQYVSGDIVIDGMNITAMDPEAVRRNVLGTQIAYIPHAKKNAFSPTLRIIKLLTDMVRTRNPAKSKAEIRAEAERHFQELGLPNGLLDRYALELLGIENQLVAIAISTFFSPKVVVANNPCFGLDPQSQKRIVGMLSDMVHMGKVKSLIFMTEDLPLLSSIADDIMIMCAGQIVEKGSAWDMSCDPVHPYSRSLAHSFLELEADPKGHR